MFESTEMVDYAYIIDGIDCWLWKQIIGTGVHSDIEKEINQASETLPTVLKHQEYTFNKGHRHQK